jgi:DNA-binding NtrC family response regulator
MLESMTQILLIGTDVPLLEGLAQSLAALGHAPIVALSLHEARELAAQIPPLIAVVSRELAAESSSDMLGISLAPGGAIVLYRSDPETAATLPPALQRAVLADLRLPLERNRLVALVQHVEDRAKATGRGRSHGSTPERLEL